MLEFSFVKNEDKSSKMVDTQHFCLRWNNYQSSITSAFENLRDDEDFVDVTLACDGRSIKAHRVVLSACSPYFRELLKSTPCKHPVIVLQDVSFPDLHALVEFIYHGEVNVHQRSLSSFLKTAEVLRVSGLTQQQAEETHSQLAQIQSLAANSGARTPISHHQFTEKLHEDPLFPRGTSPPSHLNSLHSPHSNAASVNQLLRRAAAAAALRRDRNNSTQSDELSLKRHRPDNGMPSNNNSPDVASQLPQVTAADFSTIKHNNNNTPPLKDEKNEKNEGNCQTGNGMSTREKDSLTPSPPSRVQDDVKSEPMELVCSNNNPPSDEHSNDSMTENDANRSSSAGDGKGSLSSANDEEMDSSIHSHPPPPFLMSPAESKLFSTPGSFNFSMAALADPAALAGFNSQLQSAAELAVSPQVGGNNLLGGVIVPGGSSNSSTHHQHQQHTHHQHPLQQQQHRDQQSHHQHLQHHSGPIDSPHHVGQGSAMSPTSLAAAAAAHSTASSGRLVLPLPLTACHRCDVCGKLLSTKLTLKRHKEQQHLQPLNNAVCNLCHKVFRTLNSLNNHKSIYHRRQKTHHSYLHPHHNSLHHPIPLNNNSSGSGRADIMSPHQQQSPNVIKPCMDFL